MKERDGEHRFQIHSNAAWDHLALEPARTALHSAQPQLLYFGTLAQRHAVSGTTIRQVLDETSAIRFLDLNLRAGQDNRETARASLDRADWVKLNEDELRSLLVWFVPSRDAAAPFDSTELRSALAQLITTFELARLVVTRGAQGYAAFDAKGHCTA